MLTGKNLLLLINIDSSNCRMHITTTSRPNPLSAPNFCMLLRKHLIGMKINSISNNGLERIITIELTGFNELNDFVTKKLVIELMGKHGNIILLNENNMIIDSIRHLDTFSNSTRDILPVHEYILPLGDKLDFLNINSFEEFYKAILNDNFFNSTSNDIYNTNIPISNKDFYCTSIDCINIISNTFTGISKTFLEYLLQKLSLTNNISKDNLETLYNEIKHIVNSKNLSCLLYKTSNKNDYVIDISNDKEPFKVNFFIDDFYLEKENIEEFITYRNSMLKLILAELKKYTSRLSNINKKLEECSNKDIYKLYGEIITANLYKIDNNKNLDKIELENYYDNTKITIPLDKTISPSYNAKKFFKKYNKLKNACIIVNKQKSDTSNEINYIESIVYELENAKNISDVHAIYDEISENVIFKDTLKNNKNVKNKSSKNKHSKKTKQTEEEFSPIIYTIDGYTIYVGKNNKQNDYLTLKFAHKNDLWFHTKDIHGSHVILKTNGDEIEQTLINKCASIAAYHSKAYNSSNVAVDYTFVRFVRKQTNAKPGMVIYTNYSTVNVQPNNSNI